MPRPRGSRGSVAPFGDAARTQAPRPRLGAPRPRTVRAWSSPPQVRAARLGTRGRRRGTPRAACDTRGVSTLDALARELQSTWLREIPLAAAMAIEIAACTRDELVVRAPLAPNRNLHGTAFAGSLYSLCVLTGWGATWLALRQRALDGAIVVADSRIRYRQAVSGELLCRCRPDLAALEQSLAGLGATGRASLPLTCTIDQHGKHAVRFDGEYVVHSKHGPPARA
jgi:thioesterase domain-containing protein